VAAAIALPHDSAWAGSYLDGRAFLFPVFWLGAGLIAALLFTGHQPDTISRCGWCLACSRQPA